MKPVTIANPIRSAYDAGKRLGQIHASARIVFLTPETTPNIPSTFEFKQGYIDGYRQQCFVDRLSFPSLTPLFNSPLSKSDQ